MKKILLLLFICLPVAFIKISFANAADFGFTVVASHPSAVNQPTAIGKVLQTAFLDGNKIYFGYGDYGENTGPIDIIPFDADSSTFLPKEFTSFTEAIYQFRKLSNGNLYALHTDPKYDLAAGADINFQPDFSVKDSNGWTQKMPVGMTHTFDITDYNGKIYLIGSKGNNAVVYESSDNGLSFSQSLSSQPASTTLIKFGYEEFARFYFAGQINEKLYVQPVDYWGGRQPFSKVFDGVSWADGPNLLPSGYGHNINEFLGNLIYQAQEIVGGSNILYAFNGNDVRSVLSNSRYYYIYENELYAIQCQRESCSLLKTSNLDNWELITSSMPSNTSSFVIYNGTVFIGAADANVYKANFNLKDIKEYKFSFTPPWNQVSFPFHTATTSIKSLFSALTAQQKNYLVFWHTPGETGEWKLSTAISPFLSYFVFVKEALNLTVKGLPLSINNNQWISFLNLQPGWNMIGCPPGAPIAVDAALKGISQQYSKVAFFDKTTNGYKYFYNPSMGVPAYLNDFTIFEPSVGYWVKIGN